MSKEKIKTFTKSVTVYLTNEKYDELVKITNDQKTSITQYCNDALDLKKAIDTDEDYKDWKFEFKAWKDAKNDINKDLTEEAVELLKSIDEKIQKLDYKRWLESNNKGFSGFHNKF